MNTYTKSVVVIGSDSRAAVLSRLFGLLAGVETILIRNTSSPAESNRATKIAMQQAVLIVLVLPVHSSGANILRWAHELRKLACSAELLLIADDTKQAEAMASVPLFILRDEMYRLSSMEGHSVLAQPLSAVTLLVHAYAPQYCSGMRWREVMSRSSVGRLETYAAEAAASLASASLSEAMKAARNICALMAEDDAEAWELLYDHASVPQRVYIALRELPSHNVHTEADCRHVVAAAQSILASIPGAAG